MATQIDLGAVVPIGKGDWNSSTTYERANIVRHNSTAWVCKVATSTGVEPSEDSSDWYLLVRDISSVTSVNGMRGDVVVDIVTTPDANDNSNKIANTEWVRRYVKAGIGTNIGSDGSINVNIFKGFEEGLVPSATPADAKKVLLGNGTWGSAVKIATTKEAGIVKPQTGNNDGFELGDDGTLRVRQATGTQRGSVLVSETSKAGAVPIAGTDGKIGNDWVSSMLFNSRVVITESNAAWTPPATGWARVTVIGGGGAGGGGSDGSHGGLGGKQGGTTSFGDIHAIGGSGGGGASYRSCGGGGGGAGYVVHGFVYLNTDSPVSVIIGAGGAAQKKYATGSSGTDGVGPQKGLASTIYSGGCGAAGASAGNPLYKENSNSNVYGGVGGSGGLNGSGYGGGGGGGGAGDGYYKPVPGGAAGDGGAYGTEYGGAGGAGAIIIEYYDPEKEMV